MKFLYGFIVLGTLLIAWKSAALTVRLCDDVHSAAESLHAIRQAIAPAQIAFRTGESAKQPLLTETF